MKIFKSLIIGMFFFTLSVNALTSAEAKQIGDNFIELSSNIDGISSENVKGYKSFINYNPDISYLETNLIQSFDGIKIGDTDLYKTAELFFNYQHAKNTNNLDFSSKEEGGKKGVIVINKLSDMFKNKLRSLERYNDQVWVNLNDGDYIEMHNDAINEWPSLLSHLENNSKVLIDSSIAAWSISRATFLNLEKIKTLTQLNEASEGWDKLISLLEKLQAIYGNIETLYDFISKPESVTKVEFSNILETIKENLNKIKGSDSLNTIDSILTTLNKMKRIKDNVDYTTSNDLKYVASIAQSVLKESLMDDIGSLFVNVADKVGGKKYITAMVDTRKAHGTSQISAIENQITHTMNTSSNAFKILKQAILNFKILHTQFAIDLGALLIREPELRSSVFKQNTGFNEVFPDLENGNFFNFFIFKLFNHGVVKGYPDGNFKPKNSVSIGQLLAMSTMAILKNNLKPYKNLEKNGIYFSRYAEDLNNKGIDIDYDSIKDYENNSLDVPASRGYVAKIISNLISYKFKLNNIQYKRLDGDWDTYSDFLSKNCIINGKIDTLHEGFNRYDPNNLITRDEVSLVIVKAMEFNNNKTLLCKKRKKYSFSFTNDKNIVELPANQELLGSEWKKISSDANSKNIIFSTYLGVNAYEGYNVKPCTEHDASGCNKYQCTDLVKRFYKDVFGMTQTTNGHGKSVAKNLQSHSNSKTLKYNDKQVKLTYHPSGDGERPINGSVISFDQQSKNGKGNLWGHVAIAQKVTCSSYNKCEIVLFEENYTKKDAGQYNIAFSRKAIFTKTNGKWSGLADNKHKAVGWTIAKYSGDK